MSAHCVPGSPSSEAATRCTDVDDDGEHVPQAWVDSTPAIERRHVDTKIRARVEVVQDFGRNVQSVLCSDCFHQMSAQEVCAEGVDEVDKLRKAGAALLPMRDPRVQLSSQVVFEGGVRCKPWW